MNKTRVGFAVCGSYCTFDKMLAALGGICEIYEEVTPIMSENAYFTDTRFGKAADFRRKIEEICKKPIIHDISAAEPIGPASSLDILVIAPCTGNTLAKLANGVTDTCVTMAAKAQLRSARPVLLAISTNDALTGNAQNLGALLNRKHVFFVPFYQDDCAKKPASLISSLELLPASIEAALSGIQLQPLLAEKRPDA
jgi:dipicolinate synthase subunit B